MSSPSRAELSQEEKDKLESAFRKLDTDGSGYVDVSEVGRALGSCGIKMPVYQLREFIGKYDINRDGKIGLDEIMNIKDDFKILLDKANLVTSETLAEGTTNTSSNAEKKSFSNWINKALGDDQDCQKYLPLRPDTDDLFMKCQDGILLCKLINKSVPGTIDERTINKTNLDIYRRAENRTLALNSAQSIGCDIVNIGPDDLEKGKPELVLGLLWQVIRIGLHRDINFAMNPGLVLLSIEGETVEDLQKISPEEILIRWVNHHLENAGRDRRINNFKGDIQDSEAYLYLLKQIAPNVAGITQEPPLCLDLVQKAELMLKEADKIGCRSFVSPDDVVSGNSKLNMVFVANLFNAYPALEKPNDTEYEIIEETREEKSYRNWMNSLGVQPFVHYLNSDLQDGVIIFQIYDIINPGCVDWNRVIKKNSKMNASFERLQNCNYAVELGKQQKFSLVGIGGQDLRDGNQTLTLALVWQLMRAYTLSILKKVSDQNGPITDEDIVTWANQKLEEEGKKSSFTSFEDTTLNDGKTVIDLIDCVRKGMINYDMVKDGMSEEERLSNAKYAISMSRKAGAKVYALPEDIVEVNPKMMMTIFACLMTQDIQSEK